MLLSPHELKLFFRLHRTLMFYVNQRLQVIPDTISTPEEFSALTPNVRVKVRDALSANSELIDSFVSENPAELREEELDIVRSWRHFQAGKFLVFRQLKKHAVFLTTNRPVIAYGVLALFDPFEDLTGPRLPVLVETVLLPFRDVIVYDGLMMGYNVSFGPGVRRNLNEDYRRAKERHGIVTSLPLSATPPPPKTPKARPDVPQPSKAGSDESLKVIIDLIDEFCEKHLNEEYRMLCRKLAEKLSHKRPSPLLRGNPNAWASGIVRAIGGVNFLHDKTQSPYMRATDIDHHFGISPSTGASKVKAIRKMFKLHHLDLDWILPTLLQNNPLVWMLEVDGFIVDLRREPREVQELAFRQGLIPWIPADRNSPGS